MNQNTISWKEEKKFNNKFPFSSQFRMCIVGSSGSGKTRLLYRLLLNNYFDFNKIVLCSPSLSQPEYEIIIKSIKKGLNIDQIRTLFDVQKDIKDIDSALDIIVNNEKFKHNKLVDNIIN